MSLTDETKATAPEAATTPAEVEPTKGGEKAAADSPETEEETKPDADVEAPKPDTDKAQPSGKVSKETEGTPKETNQTEEFANDNVPKPKEVAALDYDDDEEEEDDDSEESEDDDSEESGEEEKSWLPGEYQKIRDDNVQRNEAKLRMLGLLDHPKTDNKKRSRSRSSHSRSSLTSSAAAVPQRKSKRITTVNYSEKKEKFDDDVVGFSQSGDDEPAEEDEYLQDESTGETVTKSRTMNANKKDEMKSTVRRIESRVEEIGWKAWCEENQKKEEQEIVFPAFLKRELAGREINGKSILSFTPKDVSELDAGMVDGCSKIEGIGLLVAAGLRYNGATTVKSVRDRLKGYIRSGTGQKGFRKGADSAEAARTGKIPVGRNLRIPNKSNLLLTVCTIAKHSNVMTIEHGRIIIDGDDDSSEDEEESSEDEEESSEDEEESSEDEEESSEDEEESSEDEEESREEDDGQSNLQKLATAMRDSYGVNGSIRTLMKRLIECQFIIGPSTHGYYSGERVKASRYEHERLELIHPDLVPGYKPDEDSGMMRRFY